MGDVSGKGIAASMLMSNLHATLRALLGQELRLEEVLTQTSHAFCEVSLSAQFATLVLSSPTTCRFIPALSGWPTNQPEHRSSFIHAVSDLDS
jgi:hypothetical protein